MCTVKETFAQESGLSMCMASSEDDLPSQFALKSPEELDDFLHPRSCSFHIFVKDESGQLYSHLFKLEIDPAGNTLDHFKTEMKEDLKRRGFNVGQLECIRVQETDGCWPIEPKYLTIGDRRLCEPPKNERAGQIIDGVLNYPFLGVVVGSVYVFTTRCWLWFRSRR